LTADVVLPVPVDRTFTYAVPEELAHVVVRGSRVLVPFGKRRLTGVVVEVGEKSGDLKEIEDCLDDQPVFTSEVLNLTRWVASYYMCSWGLVLKAALPAGISYESKKTLSLGPLYRG
jgi:primosomal protein N' (replication factor Y)